MKLNLPEHIKSIPVLRPFLFFLSGLLVSEQFDSIKVIIVLIFFTIISLFVFIQIGKDPRINNSLSGILILILFGVSGLLRNHFNRDTPVIEKLAGDFIFIAESYPVEKENTWFVPVRLQYSSDSVYIPDNQIKANIYFEKEGFQGDKIVPGQHLFSHGTLNKIKNNGNPLEFDYAGFLRRNEIYYSGFIQQDSWILSQYKTRSLNYYAQSLRWAIEEKILSCKGADFKRSKSILTAIALGNKTRLERETKQEFSNAGAIHVMAVSGLHVGLIWMFLNFTLSIFGAGFLSRVLKFLIITMAIWLYALLTGLSPSVTRACLMFSVAGTGSLLSRKAISLNTVFLAAFIQVLIQPDVIYNLGFQFSYTAVISILLFQSIFRNIMPAGNKISSYMYDLISVSLAAQMLTFPLSIYYFHQFPALFLITNIMIIPLVTLIMMLFIFSCIFLFQESIFYFLIHVVLKFTGLMASLVEDISEIPFSVIKNLVINDLQLIILLVLPFVFLLMRYYKSLRFLKIACLLMAISILSGLQNLKSFKNPELIVFNIKSKTCIYIFTGKQSIVLSEDVSATNDFSYACSNYFIENRRKNLVYLDFADIEKLQKYLDLIRIPGEGNFIFHLAGQNLGVLTDFEGLKNRVSDSGLDLNLIIACSKAFLNENMQKWGLKSERIIISSAVAAYYEQNNENMKREPEYFFISKSGAYLHTFTGNKVKK